MVKDCPYTKEQLLDVMSSYLTQIKRDGGKYPEVVLNDIAKSIEYVLEKNRYNR